MLDLVTGTREREIFVFNQIRKRIIGFNCSELLCACYTSIISKVNLPHRVTTVDSSHGLLEHAEPVGDRALDLDLRQPVILLALGFDLIQCGELLLVRRAEERSQLLYRHPLEVDEARRGLLRPQIVHVALSISVNACDQKREM